MENEISKDSVKRLLNLLGAADPEAMRAISRQLQILEATGFIYKTTRGWSWKK